MLVVIHVWVYVSMGISPRYQALTMTLVTWLAAAFLLCATGKTFNPAFLTNSIRKDKVKEKEVESMFLKMYLTHNVKIQMNSYDQQLNGWIECSSDKSWAPVVLIKPETTASLTAKTVNSFIRSCQFSLKSKVTLEQLMFVGKGSIAVLQLCSVAPCLPFRPHLHVLYMSISANYLSIFIPSEKYQCGSFHKNHHINYDSNKPTWLKELVRAGLSKADIFHWDILILAVLFMLFHLEISLCCTLQRLHSLG